MHGKISSQELESRIRSGTAGEVTEAFNHGADPALPGLMEAALDHEDPEARIELLLGHQVKPRSSDLDKAVEKDNRAALNLLMGNGAKPTAKLVDKAIDLNKPNREEIIKSILKQEVAPTSQNLTKAFAKECAEFNVRVNALLPGFTDTKFASTLTSNKQIKNMLTDNGVFIF